MTVWQPSGRNSLFGNKPVRRDPKLGEGGIEVKRIPLTIKGELDFDNAEAAAREAALKEGGEVSLVSYYDQSRNVRCPQSAGICCGDEGYRIYAEQRGADIRVVINDGEYDCFFITVPQDVSFRERS